MLMSGTEADRLPRRSGRWQPWSRCLWRAIDARMAWDDMTGPGFWEVYSAPNDIDDDAAHRALIYQLLWCLEYDDGTARHAADTTRLQRLLAVP